MGIGQCLKVMDMQCLSRLAESIDLGYINTGLYFGMRCGQGRLDERCGVDEGRGREASCG